MHEDVRRVIAEYDASHPPECPVDKRQREIREAKEAEERAQRARETRRQVEQQQAASNSQAWCRWVDQRIGEYHRLNSENLIESLGQVIAKERDDRDKEINAAVEEAKRWFEAKLEAKLGALEGGVAQHLAQYSGRADALGDAITAERAARHKEVDAAVEEAKRWFEAKLEAKLGALEGRVAQHLAQYSGRADALGDAITAERADRLKEIKTAVEETQRVVEAKVAALEERPQGSARQAPGCQDLAPGECHLPKRIRQPRRGTLAGEDGHSAASRQLGLDVCRACRPRCGHASCTRHIRYTRTVSAIGHCRIRWCRVDRSMRRSGHLSRRRVAIDE